MEHTQPRPSTAVDLVIRFASSNPDLILTVPSPSSTSTLALKQLIRPHLPPALSSNRLRLISAGKVLLDARPLTESISIPPRPPSDPKGKQPLANPRVYIHCSIGDALSAEDLAAELSAATSSTTKLATPVPDAAPSQDPPPESRGFDRLLSSGFTRAEVAELRANFLALQSLSYTPDEMPSGAALRALEEAWLDADVSSGEAGLMDEQGLVDDMLWGNLMGFFWPVAAVMWLLREDGVWTRQKQMAVLIGMGINLAYGVLRMMNG